MDLYKQCPDSSLIFDENYSSLLNALTKHSITTTELLTLSHLKIAKLCGRSSVEISKFLAILRSQINSKIKIQHGVDPNNEVFAKFTTGDDLIDKALNGGICLGKLTEIVGSSATGKSHLLMQLAITVQLPRELGGLGYRISDDEKALLSQTTPPLISKYSPGKVVFISTEGNLETRRLHDICKNFNQLMATNGINKKYWCDFNNIFQITCNDLETQDHILFVQLPNLIKLQQKKIKLVIIDSIAHHIRVEIDEHERVSKGDHFFFQNFKKRKAYIYKLTKFLKKLANDEELAVVVANQVSDKPLTKIYNDDRLSFDYQLGWLSAWENKSIVYRQLYNGKESDERNIKNDNKNFEPISSSFTTEISNVTISQDNLLQAKFNNKGPNIESKIPSLGLMWTNQIDQRIFLKKFQKPIWHPLFEEAGNGNGATTAEQIGSSEEIDLSKNWELKRHLVGDNGKKVEFHLWKGGIRGIHNI